MGHALEGRRMDHGVAALEDLQTTAEVPDIPQETTQVGMGKLLGDFILLDLIPAIHHDPLHLRVGEECGE